MNGKMKSCETKAQNLSLDGWLPLETEGTRHCFGFRMCKHLEGLFLLRSSISISHDSDLQKAYLLPTLVASRFCHEIQLAKRFGISAT